MNPNFRISVEEIDQKILLRLEGRIDTSTAPQLEKKLTQLTQEHHHRLLLDFTQVNYLSSAGMRVLLSAAKKLKANKGHLALFALQESVAEIVRLAGFDKVLAIFSNEKEALQFTPS